MNIEDYAIYLKIDKSYSKNTIETYLINFNKYSKYCENNNIDIINVEYIDLLNYLTYLKEKEHYTPKSINTIISMLKSFYNYLLLDGYIENNPTSLLKSPKIPKKLPNYLSEEEISKLFYSIDTSKNLGKRNYLLLLLLYDTGVRVSELINIRINDIDFENKTIKIIGKGDKERLVYFTSDALAVILDYLRENNKNYLFSNQKGTPITRKEVYNIVVRCCEEAEINKHVTPHMIRHSFATHMIINDADIMSVKTILGHSNVTTTQIYTHFNKKDLKRKYDELKGKED